MGRTGIYLLVILSIVVGAAVVTDAVVVTDRERMDEFIEQVTGRVSASRIDNALSYADPSKVTMELVHDGRRRRYTDRNASALKTDARKALASLEGSKLHLIQESISLEGERARIALRLRTAAGLANTVFDLRRENDVWILRRVIVN
jgi:catechol-2,3-dioxygenase